MANITDDLYRQLNELIETYRLTRDPSIKRKIHNLVFPIIRGLVCKKFITFTQFFEDLMQESAIVINRYIEDPSYKPQEGGSFIAYIAPAVFTSCWNYVYKFNTSVSFCSKTATALYCAIKKLRQIHPDLSDEELIMLYTKQNFGGLKNKDIMIKYHENLDLYNVLTAKKFVNNVLEDGSDYFETVSAKDEITLEDLKEDLITVMQIVKELLSYPKSSEYHLTPLEGATISLQCKSIIKGKDFTNESLAKSIGVKASSFSRAYVSALKKIYKFTLTERGGFFAL